MLHAAATPLPRSYAGANDRLAAEWADHPYFAPLVELGRTAAEAGLGAVYCIHGSFAGNDPLGLMTELSRALPGLSEQLARWNKSSVDWAAGELGNFTQAYCDRLQAGLATGAARVIPVRLFHWCSQNNHIGRADGAIRLLAELGQWSARHAESAALQSPAPRVMLWGHSHGGNVMALALSLLAADDTARRGFFSACRAFHQRWCLPGHDLPHWLTVRDLLDDDRHPLRRVRLDLVTYGTPIRYGWALREGDALLHLINHRPAPDLPEYRAPYPWDPVRVLWAADGDFVQQVGIAGTNLAPNPAALRTLLADRRLGRLLQRDLARESLATRWSRGMRVAEQGVTLLADYDEPRGNPLALLAGHGVYTRSEWLPWHCQLIASELYADAPTA